MPVPASYEEYAMQRHVPERVVEPKITRCEPITVAPSVKSLLWEIGVAHVYEPTPPAVVAEAISLPCIVTAPTRELKLETDAVATNAVVAIKLLLSPVAGVGAVGVPTKVGLFREAGMYVKAPTTSAPNNVTAPVRELKLETPAIVEDTAVWTKAVVAI